MDARTWMVAALIATSFSLDGKELTSLDERVAIKKIAQYWEEKEYALAQELIPQFLSKYPQSGYVDQLYAMLADLYFSENLYEDACDCYEKIQGKEYTRKSQFHYLHSLYELQRYDTFIILAPFFLNDPHAQPKDVHTILFELAETYFCQAYEAEAGKKKELYEKAKGYYEKLKNTSLDEDTLLARAQVYEALEEFPQATKVYLALANLHEEKKEELLFHAACLQIHFDKEAALETLGQVIELKGKFLDKAAYNLLALLFQSQHYDVLIQEISSLAPHVPENKVPLVQYYYAKALFYENEADNAKTLLEKLLTSEGSTELKRPILLALVNCAKELQDVDLSRRTLIHLQKEHFSENEILEATLLHVHLCKQNALWREARDFIDRLLDSHPQHPQKENLLYDRSILLMQEGTAQKSIEAFKYFVKECPESKHVKQALNNALYLSTEVLKEKEILIEILNLSLSYKHAFSAEETKTLRFLLAHTHFDLKHFEESAGFLTEYMRDFHGDPSLSEAYLLLGACYRDRNDKYFIEYSEKALSLDPGLNLHRSLFNAYLKYIQQRPAEEKTELLSKAANHLFLVSDGSISQENQRWLASYYLEQEQGAERAMLVLEQLLEKRRVGGDFSPEVEAEVMQLANLYRQFGDFAQAVELLEALVQRQATTRTAPWKYYRWAQFELGKAYFLSGDTAKAIHIYQHLIDSSSHVSSYFALAAKMELAKLQLSKLKDEEMKEDSAKVKEICDTLKEIEIKHQPSSEPLHIEAGLLYAEIKAKLAPKNERKQRQSLLLEQIKASLSLQKEGAVPEERALLEEYLSYVEIKLSEEKETAPALKRLLERSVNDTLRERLVKDLEALETPL